MHSTYLDAIREFEGFTAKADWDYAQFTNGYGTRAKFPGEVIDKVEADRRFAAEIAEARAIVERHAPGVSEGTKAALTSLTFNAGDKWTRSGLGDAVRAGDLEQARDLFVLYNKAGGEVLPGLARRRIAEAAWINQPEANGSATTPPPPQQSLPSVAGPAFDTQWLTTAAAAIPTVAAAAVPTTRPETEARADAVLLAQPDTPRLGEVGSLADSPGVSRTPASVMAAVSSFAGEARMTQLLLASQLIGGASVGDDKPGDGVSRAAV